MRRLQPTASNVRSIVIAMGVAFAAFAGPTPRATAADGSWNGNFAGNWTTGTNWLGSVIPGSTTATNSADIATFGFTLTAGRIVTVDTNRNIAGIIFSNTSASGYTLSSGNLLLSDGGVIQSAADNGAHTDTISSAIAIQGVGGSGTFAANATNASSLLSIGAVTGVSTAGNTTTLTLNGDNTGANAVTGIIGNGAAGGRLAVAKSGNGVWRLSGVNTFSGGLTLNSGTLQLGDNAALGTGTFTIAGGAINVTAARTTTNNNAQAWNGDFTFVGSNTLNLGTGAVTLGDSRTVTVNASTLTVGGVISGVGFGLTKNGAGTLTLSGSNTFSGGLAVNAGIVASSVATGFGSGAITLGDTSGLNDARLDLTGAVVTYANNITLQAGSSGTMRIFGNANSSQTLSGSITLNRNVEVGQVNSSAQAVTFSGPIGGSGGLIVSASNVGQVRLDNATTFGGGVTVNGGSLRLGAAGTINVNYSGPTTINSGTLIVGVSGTFTNDVTNNATIQINDGTAQTLSGVISGSGNLIYNGVQARTNVVTGTNNSYTGRTDITSSVTIGKLADLGVNSSLGAPTSVANGTINLNQTTSSAARIDYVGLGDTSNRVINFLSTSSNGNEIRANGSGALVLTSNLTTAGSAKTLILSGTNTGNNTIQGIIPDGSGATSLTKREAGTWVLTGANTYTGTTTLTAGTLVVANDSALGSGPITFNGGTLQSTADRTFTNAVVLSAGSTVSGSSSITFATGGLTNSGGSRTLTNNLDAGKSLTISGTTFLQESGTGVGRTLTIAGTGSTIFSGPIVNGGTAGTSTLSVTGNATLSGSNSFNLTQIGSGGRVQIASLVNLGTGALQFNASAGNTSTLALRSDGSATFAKDASASTGDIRGTMVFDIDRATPGGPTGGTITFGNGGSLAMNVDSGGLRVTGSNGYGLTLNQSLSWAGNNQTAVPNITNNAPGLLTINGTLTGQSVNTRSFEFAGTGDILVTGSMTGASYYVNKTSAGVLTFADAVNAPGGFRVASGTLTFSGAAAVAAGQLQVVSGLFDLNGRSMSTAASNAIGNSTTIGGGAAGTTATIATGTGTLTLATNVQYNGNTANDAGGTISGNLNLGTATRTFTVNDSTATMADLTISANIGGGASGALTKAGAGMLVLSGSNSYTGATTVSTGVLLLGGGDALSAQSPLTIAGGILGLGTGNSSFTRATGGGAGQVQWNGPGGFAAYGSDATVNLGGVSGTVNAPNSMTLGDTSADRMVDFQNVLNLGSGTSKTLQVNDGSAAIDAKLSGPVVATTSTTGLIKTGAGTLWMTGSSTFTSTLTIGEGVVAVDTISGTSSANPLGQGTVALGTGTTVGTLRYTGGTASASRPITLGGSAGGGGVIEANGTGPLTLTGAVTAAAGAKTLTLGGTSTADNTFGTLADASDSAAMSLLKTGSGRWVLNGASSYSGSTTVEQGELVLATDADGTVANGALGSNANAAITIGSATGSGTVALLLRDGVTVDSRVFEIPGGSQATVIGAVDGSGTATFANVGSPSISLGRDVTLQAATNGTIVFNNPWSVTAPGSSVTVTVGSAGNAGTVELGSSLGTTGTVRIERGTLRLASGGAIASASNIVVGPAGGGAAFFDVRDKTSLAVGAAQTLSGTGTLLLDSNSPVSVAGFFSPGNSPGIFTFEGDGSGGLTTLSGTTFMEITGTTVGTSYDQVKFTSGATLNYGSGSLLLDISGIYADSTEFQLFDFTPTASGSFTTISGSGSYGLLNFVRGAGGVWTSGTTTQSSQTLEFRESTGTLVVVPEPATLALAGIGIGLAGWAALRRRK